MEEGMTGRARRSIYTQARKSMCLKRHLAEDRSICPSLAQRPETPLGLTILSSDINPSIRKMRLTKQVPIERVPFRHQENKPTY